MPARWHLQPVVPRPLVQQLHLHHPHLGALETLKPSWVLACLAGSAEGPVAACIWSGTTHSSTWPTSRPSRPLPPLIRPPARPPDHRSRAAREAESSDGAGAAVKLAVLHHPRLGTLALLACFLLCRLKKPPRLRAGAPLLLPRLRPAAALLSTGRGGRALVEHCDTPSPSASPNPLPSQIPIEQLGQFSQTFMTVNFTYNPNLCGKTFVQSYATASSALL